MSDILAACGYHHLELLNVFLERLSLPTSTALQHVWINHMNPDNIPNLTTVYDSPLGCTFTHLREAVRERMTVQSGVYSPPQVDPLVIFNVLYKTAGLAASWYIATQCHVFYNWRISSFEPLLDVEKIHSTIREASERLNKQKRFKKKKDDFLQLRLSLTQSGLSQPKISQTQSGPSQPSQIDTITDEDSGVCRTTLVKPSSPDLFSDDSQCVNPKRKFTKCKISGAMLRDLYIKYDVPFRETHKNELAPEQETFTVSPILYDIYQRNAWPKSSPLTGKSVESLLKHIIDIKIASGMDLKAELVEASSSWDSLKRALQYLMDQHCKLLRLNGYGRILKGYLRKSDKDCYDRLNVISKSTVSSFVINLLKRVLPLSFFGSNRRRKMFLSQVVRLVAAARQQSFTWLPLIKPFTQDSNDIKWCSEITDTFSRGRIVLKTVKFIVRDYIFVILKNCFYVTETGSSGFGLCYFKKSSIESVLDSTVKTMLIKEQLGTERKERFSLERKWLDTGKVDVADWERGRRVLMKAPLFQQPVAQVRILPKTCNNNEVRLITNLPQRRTLVTASHHKNRKLLRLFHARWFRRRREVNRVKWLLEYLVDMHGTGLKPLPNNPALEQAWRRMVYLKETYGRVYFVKADIKDAFGSVCHTKLAEVMDGYWAAIVGSTISVKAIVEWRIKAGVVKETNRQGFSDTGRENSVMISRSMLGQETKLLSECVLQHLRSVLDQIVFNQRLNIKGRMYRLTEGLAQGSAGVLSPLLCELYYSALDRTYLTHLLSSTSTVFLRGVDDYFVLTSNYDTAKYFHDVVCGGISSFNTSFNKHKLLTNICKDVAKIPYLGLVLNISDLTVLPDYSKYETQSVLSGMLLTDMSGNIHFKKTRWLERRVLRLNSLKLYPITLRPLHGDVATTRRLLLDSCLLQAIRVVSLTNHLFDQHAMNHLDVAVVIHKSLMKISKLVLRSTAATTRDEIEWIFYYAMLLIFKRFSGQFKDLLVLLEHRFHCVESSLLNKNFHSVLKLLKNDVRYDENWSGVKSVFRTMVMRSKKMCAVY